MEGQKETPPNGILKEETIKMGTYGTKRTEIQTGKKDVDEDGGVDFFFWSREITDTTAWRRQERGLTENPMVVQGEKLVSYLYGMRELQWG